MEKTFDEFMDFYLGMNGLAKDKHVIRTDWGAKWGKINIVPIKAENPVWGGWVVSFPSDEPQSNYPCHEPIA